MIDEYGEGLYPDLLFHYGVNLADVIAGQGPAPSLVLSLVQRLPDTSMTAALYCGGVSHFGWGLDRHLSASILDALNQNTRACGNWGKKGPPKVDPFPRPKVKTKADDGPKKKVTVRDLYRKFTGGR